MEGPKRFDWDAPAPARLCKCLSLCRFYSKSIWVLFHELQNQELSQIMINLRLFYLTNRVNGSNASLRMPLSLVFFSDPSDLYNKNSPRHSKFQPQDAIGRVGYCHPAFVLFRKTSPRTSPVQTSGPDARFRMQATQPLPGSAGRYRP